MKAAQTTKATSSTTASVTSTTTTTTSTTTTTTTTTTTGPTKPPTITITNTTATTTTSPSPKSTMQFGKTLLAASAISFCWSAYRIIDFSLSFDDPGDHETQAHFIECILGVCINMIAIIFISLLCYAVFYADALETKGRLYLIPYLVWQPFTIGFEVGMLIYTILKNLHDEPDDVVVFSIGIMLLLSVYFAVCLHYRYFHNVARENARKLSFMVSRDASIMAASSSYTSFKDVLPTY